MNCKINNQQIMKIFMLLVFDVGCINMFSLLLFASPQTQANQCLLLLLFQNKNSSTVTATTKLLIMIFDIVIAFLVLFCCLFF